MPSVQHSRPLGAAFAAERAAKPFIRDCVATPSRVLIYFDGEPDIEAAQDGASYRIVKLTESDREYGTGPPEYDPDSRVSVLRNPITDLELGDWLQVTVSGLGRTPSVLTYFVRIQSELPLVPAVPPAPEDRPAASRTRRWFDLPPTGVVVIGLVALVILGGLAMVFASAGDMQTIATAAFGVIGSVVGAFFGIHAGLGDRDRVERKRELEATKGQMLAVMMPEHQQKAALEVLKEYSPREQ